MIDKILITKKLEKFFKLTNPESFLKIFIISFLFDKINYIETIVGTENSINMLDKYIYNLEINLKLFKKIDNYNSIYAKYDFKNKTLKYCMVSNYRKIESQKLSKDERKSIIIKEFKIMMYKELENIISIYSSNGRIISSGFYIDDKKGRYPEYNGDFSNIIDIFSDFEVCNITDVNDKIKIYIDENKEYYIYSRHMSQRNSEVIGYIGLWKNFMNIKLYYFAMNNPKKYTENMINDFNTKYEYILKSNYDFLLKNKDVFSLIENYLLHIRNRINIENNVQYHQDLSVIFKMMNNKKRYSKLLEYILHSENQKLNFQKI